MKRLIFIIGILLAHQVVDAQKKQHILITYYSSSGSTTQMAKAIAEGVLKVPNTDVVFKSISETTQADLLSANAIIIGSPVYNANPAPEVLKFIQNWPFEGAPLKNKLAAVFVTGGGISSGEELVQSALMHSMLIFGMVIVGGETWKSAFGASAITDEPPFSQKIDASFLNKATQLGTRVAEASLRWNK